MIVEGQETGRDQRGHSLGTVRFNTGTFSLSDAADNEVREGSGECPSPQNEASISSRAVRMQNISPEDAGCWLIFRNAQPYQYTHTHTGRWVTGV